MKSQNDTVILEIRAGTGGDEAGLFAANLYRMYTRYGLSKKWKLKRLSLSEGGLGNIKSVTVQIEGENVYKKLINESGVHRVQRVPSTESSGRIHTSTATVAVLPLSSDTKLKINPKDLKIAFFRATGHGGQNVNKVETAVRITHLPTATVAVCQDERSQYQNREKALTILSSRLYEMMRQQKKIEVDQLRHHQVGTAERSEKIRTYNYPQNRVTDHRLRKSWHNIDRILDGTLDPIIKNFLTYKK